MKPFLILIVLVALGNSYQPIDVKRAFIESGIVPDIMKTPPKKIINVSVNVCETMMVY